MANLNTSNKFIKHFIHVKGKESLFETSVSLQNNFTCSMFFGLIAQYAKTNPDFSDIVVTDFYYDGTGKIVWVVKVNENMEEYISTILTNLESIDDQHSELEWHLFYPTLKEDPFWRKVLSPFSYMEFNYLYFRDDLNKQVLFNNYNGKAIFNHILKTLRERMDEHNNSLPKGVLQNRAVLINIAYTDNKHKGWSSSPESYGVYNFCLMFQGSEVVGQLIQQIVEEWTKTLEDVTLH